MRFAALALATLLGCATHSAPPLPLPPAENGSVSLVARALPPVGDVQPIEIALTNGSADDVHVVADQVEALDDQGRRFAPLPPAEAARRAGGSRLPGSARGAATGAATGGALGAIGGIISGAIQGG